MGGVRFRIAAVLLLTAAVAIAARPLLSLERTTAYRDAGHYYAPLYRWQADSIALGDGILWDRHDDGGRSLAADPTAATFYPPAWLLRIGPGPWGLRWNGYLVGHLLLAAFGAAWGARRLGIGREGAIVAGVVYGSAGAVVSQVDNVVFLVGAAWLPIALGAGWRAVVDRASDTARALSRDSAIAGGAIGLMMLGGDPQGAVHALLGLGLAALLSERRRTGNDTARPTERFTPLGLLASLFAAIARCLPSVGRVAVIGAIAAAVAAVQWVPSLDAAGRIDRAVRRESRSLYEAARDLTDADDPRSPRQRLDSVASGLFAPPTAGTHHEFASQFSLAPWQLADLFWPGWSGSGYPEYRRWTDAIPAADRPWFPSIHLGLVALLLALSAWSLRRDVETAQRCGSARRWISALLLAATLLAFGWYGLGWIAQELSRALPTSERFAGSLPDGPVGGVWWFVTNLVPGYASFRYPAKAFVVATLGFAWLAGCGTERVIERGPSRLGRLAAAAAILSGVALVVAWSLEGRFRESAERLPAELIFGPLDVDGAWRQLLRAVSQGLIVAAIAWGAAIVAQGRRRRHPETPIGRRRAGALSIALTIGLVTIVETSLAHRQLIVTAPLERWETPSGVAETLRESLAEGRDDGEIPRGYRARMEGWAPSHWSRTSDRRRLDDVIAWDRASAFPKHQHADRLQLIESPGSGQDAVLWMTMHVARERGRVRTDGWSEPEKQLLDGWSVEYLIVPSWDVAGWREVDPTLRLVDSPKANAPEEVAVLLNERAAPRLRIVEQAAARPLPDVARLDDLWRAIDRILADPQTGPEAWDERAVLDLTAGQLASLRRRYGSSAASNEPTSLRPGPPHLLDAWWSQQRVDVAVDVPRDAWLVMAESWGAGWQAEARTAAGTWESRPVVRADLVLRAVPLRAGDDRVRLRYEPVGGPWPAIVSILAALAVMTLSTFYRTELPSASSLSVSP